MGALGKMFSELGCDLVTGTEAFSARRGFIYAFVARAGAKIASFEEVPVPSINDAWMYAPGTEAETITDRTYSDVELEQGETVWFDGPVTSITLSAGAGWVYYCD